MHVHVDSLQLCKTGTLRHFLPLSFPDLESQPSKEVHIHYTGPFRKLSSFAEPYQKALEWAQPTFFVNGPAKSYFVLPDFFLRVA